MGRPHVTHILFSCERNSFVVAGSKLFRYPSSKFERSGVCVSSDGTPIWQDG
jgi:hypothetical protein